jgi:hypothetical protein
MLICHSNSYNLMHACITASRVPDLHSAILGALKITLRHIRRCVMNLTFFAEKRS